MSTKKKTRSKRVTKLKKPVIRRIGTLIVAIHEGGISIRGKHKRRWRTFNWNQVASLADGDEPICLVEETARGKRALAEINADPERSDFLCRNCGVECPIAPINGQAICENCCADHAYEYDASRRHHHCKHCDKPVDPDWYDVD